tara:strand:+ start:381 stop:989 length:609 start_codon:yes stop_codon:yes gene_type:complete
MAENKKSFVLYCDLIHNIDHLTNEEKGILFNHLLEYVNDLNPVLEDRLIMTAWKPIKRQLKRDLQKFQDVKGKRSEAGKRSAEIRALKKSKQSSTKSTSVESVKQSLTNPTVNDNVNDNVIINNKQYLKNCLNDMQFLEVFAMQSRTNLATASKYLKDFELHCISIQEQKESLPEFKSHFNNWIKKNNISKVQPPLKKLKYV